MQLSVQLMVKKQFKVAVFSLVIEVSEHMDWFQYANLNEFNTGGDQVPINK